MPVFPFRPMRAWFLLSVLLVAWATPVPAADFGDPGSRMRVVWRGGLLVAGVYPQSNEGYIQLARRVMEKPEAYRPIVAFNGKAPVRTGVPVYFPITVLKPVLWARALRALYPEDELTARGWSHHVTDPNENLIQLTEAYTGSKGRFKELARYNRLKNPNVLPLGTVIHVPLHWIPEALGFRPLAVKKPLRLVKQEKSGRIYAAYTVRRNDTLYSLLLRFTDRERADEIRRMSGLVVKINKLTGEKRLYAGREMRIPVEWVSEDYLVSPHPRKTARVARPKPRPQRRRVPFQPLHVIVDAGHGGTDPGAVYGKKGKPDYLYEHEVVNDIALRLIGLLKARGIRAYPTVEDPGATRPVERLSTRAMGGERVRVNPPYKMRSSKVAVNMRIFLINALYRRLTQKEGVDPENVVLISLHGDALAPTLRGAMVYYPDHRLRVGEFYPKGRVYRLRAEAVPGRLFFRRADNRIAEVLSRDFGERIIRDFKARGLGAAHRRAVRPYYYRKGERTLPGVLRYSQVPTSVLVEVANLNNRAERLSLLKGARRQRIARALAAALTNLHKARRTPQIAKKAS